MCYNPVDNVGYITRQHQTPEKKARALLTNIIFSLPVPFQGFMCNIKSQLLKSIFLKAR